MINKGYIISDIGIWELTEKDGFIISLDYKGKSETYKTQRESPLIKEGQKQLEEYFKRKRKAFDLPLKLEGTDFQKRVWEALLTIPYGEVCSYQDIARKVGNIKAVRAVGGANNKNPIAIIVPCHRVIGKDGSLVGYGGGLQVKEFLLSLEKSSVE